MKKLTSEFIALLTALVLVASALILCCGFTYRLPKGVKVNGEDVSRLTVAAAKTLLRERTEQALKQKRLHICADERVYEYSYPEIDFTDGFEDTLKSIRKSGEYSARVTYFLNGAEEIADGLCSTLERAPKEPYAVFNAEGEPFTYYGGEDGIVCDRARLLSDIASSLNGAFEDVRICTDTVKCKYSLRDVKNRTKKLYSFTTYFDADNADRSYNIRLAASKINGLTLGAGQTFSFNGVVGARTQANGFRQAKIIENGKFVQGFGGGVCQVSTTVYNAALLSGLEICEYHPHSLRVSYVSPSRDAMVSGSYFDLKFKNTRLTPIYVRVNCTLSSVCCTIYGESDGYEYSFRSQVTGTVPRPPAVTIEGEEDKVISYGRDGTVSEGYLIRKKGGQAESTLIRKDKYLAVADVVMKSGAG